MKLLPFLLAVATAGCSHDLSKHTTTSASFIELSNGAGGITFESPHAKGSINVSSPMPIRCESTVTGSVSTTRWTVDGREFDFTGTTLELGGKTYGTLKGDTQIEIRPDGVFVNGEKRGELPR
jgi:hypothetical protein